MSAQQEIAQSTEKVLLEVDGHPATVRQMLTGRKAGYWLVEEVVPDGEIPWIIGISPNSRKEAMRNFRCDLAISRARRHASPKETK